MQRKALQSQHQVQESYNFKTFVGVLQNCSIYFMPNQFHLGPNSISQKHQSPRQSQQKRKEPVRHLQNLSYDQQTTIEKYLQYPQSRIRLTKDIINSQLVKKTFQTQISIQQKKQLLLLLLKSQNKTTSQQKLNEKDNFNSSQKQLEISHALTKQIQPNKNNQSIFNQISQPKLMNEQKIHHQPEEIRSFPRTITRVTPELTQLVLNQYKTEKVVKRIHQKHGHQTKSSYSTFLNIVNQSLSKSHKIKRIKRIKRNNK